jgi:hypothetical protein
MKEDLAKKSPEERKAAIQKLMEQGRQFGFTPPAPEPDDGKDKKKKDDGDKKREEKRTEERRTERRRDDGPRGGGPLEERMARLESKVDKLAQALERLMGDRGGERPGSGERRFLFQFPRPGERGGERSGDWQREPWGMRGEPGQGRPRTEERGRREERGGREERNDERRGPRFDFFRGGDQEQLRERLDDIFRNLERHLRDMERDFRERFDRGGDRGRDERRAEPRRERRGRDRDEDEDDDDDRGGFNLRDAGGSLRDVIQGLTKLASMLEPQDLEIFVRLVEGLVKNVGPEDLQDLNPGKLMLKVQESVDPQDMGRLMEIFGNFIATPEGRALAKRLEGLGGQLPKLQPPRREPAPKAPGRRASDEERKTEHGIARLY